MKDRPTTALLVTVMVVGLSPRVVLAGAPQNFTQLVGLFLNLILLIIPLIAALCMLAFFWGLAKFILDAGDERARTEGKRFMLWGLIALFVMVSLWGIVSIFTNTLGVPLFIPLLPV